MKGFILILFLSGGIFCSAIGHPLHVSMVNIEFNREDSTFTLAAKIFTDDFEAILLQKYGIVMNLGKENEYKEAGKYFSKYIDEKFCIIFDSIKANMEFVKKEQNFEAVWLYFNFKSPESITKIEISNQIMFDMFNDQKNLVIFNFNNQQKAFMFNHKKSKEFFETDN